MWMYVILLSCLKEKLEDCENTWNDIFLNQSITKGIISYPEDPSQFFVFLAQITEQYYNKFRIYSCCFKCSL